jgi:hypothetical protein
MANDKLFDTRVVRRNLREDFTNQAEYEAHLSNLPDEAAEGEETETRMESVLAPASETSKDG